MVIDSKEDDEGFMDWLNGSAGSSFSICVLGPTHPKKHLCEEQMCIVSGYNIVLHKMYSPVCGTGDL